MPNAQSVNISMIGCLGAVFAGFLTLCLLIVGIAEWLPTHIAMSFAFALWIPVGYRGKSTGYWLLANLCMLVVIGVLFALSAGERHILQERMESRERKGQAQELAIIDEMFNSSELAFDSEHRFPWDQIESVTYVVDEGSHIQIIGAADLSYHTSIIVKVKGGGPAKISTSTNHLCDLGRGKSLSLGNDVYLRVNLKNVRYWITAFSKNAPEAHLQFLVRGSSVFSNMTVGYDETTYLYPRLSAHLMDEASGEILRGNPHK